MEIIDRTAMAARFTHNNSNTQILSRFGTTRPLGVVDGIMLHQMAFDRGNDLASYDMVIGHYAVTNNGTISQLRPLDALLNDARGRKSVHIEFAGNYPGHERPGTLPAPTLAQIRAGRWLMRHLCEGSGLSIRYVLAHRQWNLSGRPRDPGPHLWFNVALWAKQSLGLTSDPPGREAGDIPAAWESSRFDVDARGTGNIATDRGFLRRASRAIGVKLHDGGVIGIYATHSEAEAERGADRAWLKAQTWECWLRRRSQALEVELMEGGVVGFYRSRGAAESESESLPVPVPVPVPEG